MDHVRLRSDLDDVPRYVAGRPPRTGSLPGFKLSSNELPCGPDSTVLAAAARAVADANRYPDIASAELVARLSAHLDVDRERIVVGGGSIALLQQLVQSVTDPGSAVVFAWRSYEAYPIVTRVCGAAAVAVPLAGDRHDLEAMADAVARTDARLVIVCSPNNPTGTAVGSDELERFLDAVPARCVVVLDEAYREFVDDPGVPDGVHAAEGRSNVVVLRTFSKAHGLAALRVGYCVAPTPVAQAMRVVALPFTASTVAQQAAIAALDAWPRQRLRVADVLHRRHRLVESLRFQGFRVPDSQANFVWLPLGEASSGLVDALGDAGISVRGFDGDGVRITVGEPEALERLLRVTAAAARRRRPPWP